MVSGRHSAAEASAVNDCFPPDLTRKEAERRSALQKLPTLQLTACRLLSLWAARLRVARILWREGRIAGRRTPLRRPMPPEPLRIEPGKTWEPFDAGCSFQPPTVWPWRIQPCRSFRPSSTFIGVIGGGAELHECFLMPGREKMWMDKLPQWEALSAPARFPTNEFCYRAPDCDGPV